MLYLLFIGCESVRFVAVLHLIFLIAVGVGSFDEWEGGVFSV